NQKRETLVGKVTENAEVEIPQAMVTSETDQMLKEFDQRLQMQGMDLNTYFQFSGQTEEQLKEQMQEDAHSRVKTNLTLETIVEEEGPEVTDEDIDAEAQKMAGM